MTEHLAITEPQTLLLVARSSELTINGGTFTNPNSGRGAIVTDKQFVGTVTINGGVFENTNAGGYSILDSNEAISL